MCSTGAIAAHDAIESIDPNNLLRTEAPVNAELHPAPDLNGAQFVTQGVSNGLDTISGHHQHSRRQSEDLASLGELPRDAWNASGSASTGSKEICLRERSVGDEGHNAKNACNEALYSGSRRCTSRETLIMLDDHSSEDEDAQDPGREGGSSQVHRHNDATF